MSDAMPERGLRGSRGVKEGTRIVLCKTRAERGIQGSRTTASAEQSADHRALERRNSPGRRYQSMVRWIVDEVVQVGLRIARLIYISPLR